MMRFSVALICPLVLCLPAVAVEIRGTVLDPTDAAIPGAEVAALSRVGLLAQVRTGESGEFLLSISEPARARLLVTAAGFATRTVPLDQFTGEPITVRLNLAPQVDSVRVVGSALDVPLSEQGASISLIPREEITARNEAQALDLLRYLPGVSLTSAGQRGGFAGLFLRGGNYNFTLVQVDGVPVNSFGGPFDFAHIPAAWLERIEVVRGAQSAVYGSYANTGAINFVTRSADTAPAVELVAEGGSHEERRFVAGASGTLKGFGLAAFASHLESNGPVANGDYRNQGVALHATRRFSRQYLSVSGNFDSNDIGVPGPYGSDPKGLYPGLDLVSRNKNNTSSYLARYQADLSDRLRQEFSGAFFLNHAGFRTPYGFSTNQDRRGQAESRTILGVTRTYTMAAGVSFAREEVRNDFITDDRFRALPLRRDVTGLYWENRWQLGGRAFVNAGLRGDLLRTPAIAGNGGSGRPPFRENTIAKVNPKLAVAYIVRQDGGGVFGSLRLHGSFGTGIRPPSGFELAFTDNPALKPERTASLDAGIEQRLLGNRVSVDATWFYNRFSDLIVSLGGSLAELSSYQSDNLSNSRAQGLEAAVRVRPARWVSLEGNYTHLRTEILSLSGSSGLAPAFFRVGQPLLRRPAHAGAFVSSFTWRRVSANISGYARGEVLDVEPNLGAFAGLFPNPGFFNLGVNLNYRLGAGVTLYGNLRNALNQAYEEAFGLPSPKLNFVTGLKWTLSGAR